VANIGATDTPASVTVAIGRDVAVAPGKTDNGSRVIRIAVTVTAIIIAAAPADPTALPAVPGGFGRNSQ
jgi:hypothetical protein